MLGKLNREQREINGDKKETRVDADSRDPEVMQYVCVCVWVCWEGEKHENS